MAAAMFPRFLLLTTIASLAVAQQAGSFVVPSSAAILDGSHAFFIAGSAEPRRQLTLLDGPLLAGLQGRQLIGCSFRRNAENEPFLGGTANLTIRLSHSPLDSLSASPMFSLDHGPDLQTVFQGQVTFPNSPDPGTNIVPWTSENVVSIVFTAPFTYHGGALAIDIFGTPDQQQFVTWWPADAVWQPAGGLQQSFGTGSGPYGSGTGEWAYSSSSNLAPGGTVGFMALGEFGSLGLFALSDSVHVQNADLSVFGVPGTWLHIAPPFSIYPAFFDPIAIQQQPALGALADIHIHIPSVPAFLSVSFSSQWFRLDGLGRLFSSNALQSSTSAQLPSLGIALVSADATLGQPTSGKVTQSCGHVFRFDFQ